VEARAAFIKRAKRDEGTGAMKFDMGAAWADAVRLISGNRQVLLILAGVFFFLPYAIFMMVFMNEMGAVGAAQRANADSEAVGQAAFALYGDMWWLILIMAVVQGIGMLGLLALLTDRSRPTVGEALGTGAKLLLPYLGAQLLISFLMGMLLLFPIAVGVAASTGAGVLVGIVAAVVLAYLFTKFMLVAPVIAIDRIANPLAALSRSWRLTKGNSLRLFAFIVLVMVAAVIVGTVASMVIGLPFALMGAEAALVGQAIGSSVVNAIFMVIFLAVLAAIHRQLAGRAPAEDNRGQPVS
jgi:hypothetical protein